MSRQLASPPGFVGRAKRWPMTVAEGFGAAGTVRRTLPQTGRPVRDSQIPRIGIWRPHRDSNRPDTTLLLPFAGEVFILRRAA